MSAVIFKRRGPLRWQDIPGWFHWRAGQEEAVRTFPEGSRHLLADIEAWQPKVTPGGWLSGDDYDPERWPEVVRTVQERLPEAVPWSTNQWRLVRR